LRAILKANRDRAVRCRAQFALASVVQNAPEQRQEKAEALFEQYCAEFDGKYVYPFQGIERMLNGLAQAQLNERRLRAVGRELTHMTAILIDAARRKIRLDAMHAVVTALPFSRAPKAIIDPQPTATRIEPNTGFFDKVFREVDGSESK
jgi:hypothetical protein